MPAAWLAGRTEMLAAGEHCISSGPLSSAAGVVVVVAARAMPGAALPGVAVG